MSEIECNMNGSLAGKVAVVTGASRGIGEAICYRLAMEGAKVVPSARTAQSGDHPLPGTIHETAQHIRDRGGEATAIRCDLAEPEQRQALIEQTIDAYGPVDILVSNAAITYFIPVERFDLKRYDLMFEVQVKAPFHLAQLVLPSMKERGTGAIVNISSGAGRHPKPQSGGRGGTVYGMCKAALERFTTGLASEVYKHGISVNVVSPGLVATPGVVHHQLINDRNRSRVQPIEYIAESVYQLAAGDPATMTGRIDYADPFLKELGVEPSKLLRDFEAEEA